MSNPKRGKIFSDLQTEGRRIRDVFLVEKEFSWISQTARLLLERDVRPTRNSNANAFEHSYMYKILMFWNFLNMNEPSAG